MNTQIDLNLTKKNSTGDNIADPTERLYKLVNEEKKKELK